MRAIKLLAAIAATAALLSAPLFVFLLRTREERDPELCPRPRAADLEALQELEDHDITNQYTAIGAVKNMARPETNTVSPIMRAS